MDELWVLSVFSLLLLGGYLLFNRMDKRIKMLEMRLNELSNGNNPAEVQQVVNEELRKLLVRGKIIEAVRKAREEFGISLLDAKRYVDKL